LGGPLSKLCVTPPFSINFRCQIENQVSDYRLLGASSFNYKTELSVSVVIRNTEFLLKMADNEPTTDFPNTYTAKTPYQ
jgi:hypothetical protein